MSQQKTARQEEIFLFCGGGGRKVRLALEAYWVSGPWDAWSLQRAAFPAPM